MYLKSQFVALICLTSLGLVTMSGREVEADEATASAALKELGAVIVRNSKQPREPVVEVRLINAKLSDADLALLKAFPKLKSLDLHGATISDAALAPLAELSNLEYVDLGNTKIDGSGLVHLKGHAKLHTILLRAVGVHNSELLHLKDLTNLRRVVLTGAPIGDDGLVALANSPVQSLLVGGTQITDAGLAHLKDHKNLDHLTLSDTKITDAGLAHLQGLTKLRQLDVSRTKVTAGPTDELRKALPKCKIFGPGE